MDKRITELPPGTDLAAVDLLAKVDDPNGTPVTQKITGAMLATFIGAQNTQVYQGRDPAPPDDPTKAALNYPSGGGSLTQWDVGSQAWV
jgi:hypothetical protein